MSFSARYLPVVLLATLSFSGPLCAQPSKQPTKVAGGSVSGRVTIKEKAAVGVVVGLRRSQVMPYESVPRATTDQDGIYRITNVPPGAYEVVPAAPGFVLDARDARGKPVQVAEDENVDNINFALVRGGVITGRITDADGRPVIQQQVNIYPANALEPTKGPPRPVFPTAGVQTDDRGIYRAYGLAAGRYKISAGRSDDGVSMTLNPNRSAYKQVFYPDATEAAAGKVIEVTEASEAKDIDIVLGRAMQTYSVSGKIVDGERGLPVPNLRFGVQRIIGTRFDYTNVMTVSNTLGDFVMEGLAPGTYSVFVFQGQTNELRAETLTFEVIDQDLTGLTVKVTRGSSVTGFVTFETENKAALAKLSELQLRGYVASATGSFSIGSSAQSPIAPDGSFRLSGLPGGVVNFTIGAINNPFPPKGISLVRIEREGVPITGRGIDIKEGEQLTGVRVVLSYGNASIRGFVKLENGSLPEGSRIFVRLSKQGENNTNLFPPQVDVRGHFLMEGIPPGTYEIIANVGGMNAPTRQRSAKRVVTLQDGIITDLEITIDMSEAPKP